jgi:hypothetical protein
MARAGGTIFLGLALLAGCAEPPATRVPTSGPFPIAVDEQRPVWTLERLSNNPALRMELERRNMTVVAPAQARAVAQIDLGVWGDHHVVDVYLARDGRRSCLARIRIPDQGMTTLDVTAGWVAELVARAIVTPPAPTADVPCGYHPEERWDDEDER